MATLTDSGGFSWTTSYSSVQTTADAYDSGLALYHNLPGFMTSFSGSTETTEDLGREIVYGPQVSNEVSVVRKQFVSSDHAFARFLESFTNTGTVSKTFIVEIRSNIYSDSATVVTATSDGDTAVESTDKWIVVDNSASASFPIPAAAHIFAGVGAPAQPSAVTLAGDIETYQFQLTLAPGQTKIIMHFASLADLAATAAANATALAALPSYALSGMSTAELASVVNFNSGYVFKGVWYTLAAGEQNLQLTGSANIDGTGNSLNNVLVGNGGNNTLKGMAGNDTLNGGTGTDTASYAGATAGVTVNLGLVTAQNTVGAGTDTLISIENLTGSSLNDTLTGNTGNNVLIGGAGNDTLNGSTGTDTASYAGATAGVTVNLAVTTGQNTVGAGTDMLTAIESLTGSSFNDTLTGNSGANLIDGGVGNDTMIGGLGDDIYIVNVATDVVTEGSNAGTDLVQSSATYTLPVNVENLTLLGTSAINATGNTLNNVLTGNAANNILNGGTGTDTASYAGAAAGVTVNLAVTTGQITGGAGTDTLTAIENLTGSNFNDTLTGNTGNNVLIGGLGNDTLNGSTGIDTASYASATAGVTVNLGLVAAQNTVGAGTDTLTAIENLTGSNFNDTLTGNSGNNVLNGNAGTDTVSYANAAAGVTVNLGVLVAQNTVGAGTDTLTAIENLTGSNFNDTLTGTTGNNTLNGGTGNDTMIGGTGNDIFLVNSTLDVVTEASNAGTDLVQSSATYTLSANVENLTLLGAGNLNGTGNTGNNIITGNSGNNVLNGGAGNDVLLGGDGNDRFILSAGNDVISGGAGDDTIVVNEGFGTVEIRDTLGIEQIDFSAVDSAITINLTPGSVNTVAGGNLTIFGGGAVSEPLDLFFVQDVSQSFADDFPTVQGLVPQIVNSVRGFQSDSNFGVGTFIDKELMDGEHLYRTELRLTSNQSQLAAEYGTFYTVGNIDTPEASLEALMQATIRTSEVGWRSDSLRVALVLTDAPFHFGGDGTFNLPPNDGDTVLDGSPPGNGEDYPTIEMVRDKLVANDVLPVFAVTSDVLPYYQALVSVLGFGEVVSISSSSNDIVNAIQAALLKATAAKIDRIIGTPFADSITGSQYNNVIDGGLGTDIMAGGLGDDIYIVNVATDVVTEGSNAGTDLVQSSATTYTLSANVENLTLLGTSAINATGNTLDNVLTGNAGNNILNGGTGTDTASYASATAGVTVNLGVTVAQNTIGAGTDTLTAIENLTGSNFNDTLTGNTGNNVLIGGAGNDTLNGSTGTDTASYASATAGVTVNLAVTTGQITGGAGTDTLISIENLTGSAFNDTLTGNTGNNVLIGGPGADTLNGGDGNDTLVWDAADVSANGGLGATDVLRVDGTGQTLNLLAVANAKIQNVEVIDLTGSGNNRLELSLQEVLDLSSTTDTLRVDGNAGDVVVDNTAFWDGGVATTTVGANVYRIYTLGMATATLLVDTDITVDL